MTATIDQIVTIAQTLAPGRPVTAVSSLESLELDSLECLELTALVEDHFDVVIGCADRISCETLADLAVIVDVQARPLPLAA